MRVAVIYNPAEVRDSDVINVFGMPTKERYSPRMVEMVASALEKGGHNVRIIEGNKWVIDELQSFMPRVVEGQRPGMVYNMAYGIQGVSRYTHLPAMLEMLGIPYVGSGPAGHAVALDKVLTKIVFQRYGLPTPRFWLFSVPGENLEAVRYPVIVKPKMEAVSSGVRVARTEPQLREAIEAITGEFQQQALVEEFIPGREFAVGLLGNGESLETLPIVEIDLEGDPDAIQSLDDKMQRPRRKICPAPLPEEQEADLKRLAREAFNALGLLDFARVDFRVDSEGRPHMLEVNSMASVNATGSFVHAAGVAGMDFTALINRMLDVAAARYFGPSHAPSPTPERPGTSKRSLPVRVRTYMRAHSQEILESLEEMVAVNSHAHDIDAVNTLGERVSSRFEALGFRRQVFAQSEAGNVLYFSNGEGDRSDILLLGHLDTVHDYESHVAMRVERGRVIGSGVAESKGGITAILFALQALRFARALKRVRCAVLLTSDDTIGGRFSRGLVAEAAGRAARVVGTKYGDLNGGIVTSCSGMQEYEIELTAVRDNRKHPGRDVIAALSRKVLALTRLADPPSGAEVVVRRLNAQASPGRLGGRATAGVLARFVSQDQGRQLDEMVRRIVERNSSKGLHVRIRPVVRCPAVLETEASRRFFEEVRSLAERLEVRVEPVHRPSPADICHVPEGVPVLGGFGPLGGDVRSQSEYILRDSLIERAALLALVIHESALNR